MFVERKHFVVLSALVVAFRCSVREFCYDLTSKDLNTTRIQT
jgi:hypothetical protein